MKGPNPFAPWSTDPEGICGRREEEKVFSFFANGTASKQGAVLLVRGGPGCGKTAMLEDFRQEAEKAGLLAPFVRAERNESLDSVVDKARQELPQRPGLRNPGAGKGIGTLIRDVEGIAANQFGAIVFIDDFDNIRKADEALGTILKTAKAGWGKRNLSFVASTTRSFEVESGLLQSMELRPFDAHDARELVEKALKKGPPKMGEECLQSILEDCGGNPRLVKTVCYNIYERLRDNEKVINKGHYLAYLPQIMGTLSREWFGRMYQETPPGERALLHVLAKEDGGLHVSDIAKKAGKPPGPASTLMKRLLESGQIVRLARGKYRVFSRLYGRYVAQRS
jgi:hypothetical protein